MPHRVRLLVAKTGLPAGSIGTVIDELEDLDGMVVEFAGEDIRVIPNDDLEDVQDEARGIRGGAKNAGEAGGKSGRGRKGRGGNKGTG